MRDARSEPGMTKQTAVIPDLIGDLRAFGLGPSPRRKDAKRMTMGTCYAGFHGHAD